MFFLDEWIHCVQRKCINSSGFVDLFLWAEPSWAELRGHSIPFLAIVVTPEHWLTWIDRSCHPTTTPVCLPIVRLRSHSLTYLLTHTIDEGCHAYSSCCTDTGCHRCSGGLPPGGHSLLPLQCQAWSPSHLSGIQVSEWVSVCVCECVSNIMLPSLTCAIVTCKETAFAWKKPPICRSLSVGKPSILGIDLSMEYVSTRSAWMCVSKENINSSLKNKSITASDTAAMMSIYVMVSIPLNDWLLHGVSCSYCCCIHFV